MTDMDHGEVMKQAAWTGGEILRRYFGQELVMTEKKNAADLRTKADTESEEAVLQVLTQAFPTYNILTEEQGSIDKQSDYTFIIDPLDGTNNFVMGMPYFSVAIGLMHSDVIQEAVVYHPILDNLYYAQAGKGIDLNANKLHVNTVEDMLQVTISSVLNYQPWTEEVQKVEKVYGRHDFKRVLHTWSPALDACLLATGKIEAMYSDVTAQDEFYDYSIGKFMIKEGGGKVTDFTGNPDPSVRNGQFIASNGTEIHEKLLKILCP